MVKSAHFVESYCCVINKYFLFAVFILMDNSCFLRFCHFYIVYSVHYDGVNNLCNTKKYAVLYIMCTVFYINNVNVISDEVMCYYCCIKLPSEANNNYFIIYTCKKSLKLQPPHTITFNFETFCCGPSSFSFASNINLLT